MSPLTLNEARMVAEKMRGLGPVDRGYWPWVVEELCRMLESKHIVDGPTQTCADCKRTLSLDAFVVLGPSDKHLEYCFNCARLRIKAKAERDHRSGG